MATVARLPRRGTYLKRQQGQFVVLLVLSVRGDVDGEWGEGEGL